MNLYAHQKKIIDNDKRYQLGRKAGRAATIRKIRKVLRDNCVQEDVIKIYLRSI